MSASTPTAQRSRDSATARIFSGRTGVHLAMGLMIVYFTAPIWWLLVNSTKDTGGLFSSPALWFSSSDHFFGNLRQLFAQDHGAFFTWFLNTLIYSGAAGVGATIVSTLAGYAFAKFDFPGRRILFSVLLGMIMIPSTALVIPLYLVMSKLHMVNTRWAVILPSLLVPFAVYLVRVFVQDSVPTELLEAARVDGSGEVRTFLKVVLPVIRPAIVTVFIFSFVSAWNNYFLPLIMLSNNKLYPLTVGLTSWYGSANNAGQYRDLFPVVITGALVTIVPLIAGFVALQRYWAGGLTMGSVK